MNRTIALIAVVLSLITALFVFYLDANEAAYDPDIEYIGGIKYYVIDDADSRTYTDEDLPSKVSECNGRIYIETSGKSIMDNAFKDCSKIMIVYTYDIKSIGASAFEGCSNLSSFISETGLVSVGDAAFKNTGLTEVILNDTTTKIGAEAFYGCHVLRGPVLFGTSVSKIYDRTFMNSGLRIEDLRNITSISSTAFGSTDMYGQILREGQSAKIYGVPAIYIDDFEIGGITLEVNMEGSIIKLEVAEGISIVNNTQSGTYEMTCTDEQWDRKYHFCNMSLTGEDFHLSLKKYRIVFESYLGVPSATHISGSGTYTLPQPPIGASIFNGWKIEGLNGYRDKITETEFNIIGDPVRPVAEFRQLTLSFDHSDVVTSAGYSGLPASMKFSVNSTYPVLDDIPGFNFSGWKVGNSFYNGGASISELKDHTAKSMWNATKLTLTLHNGGRTVSSDIAYGTKVVLSDLVYQEMDSKRFIGWSKTENGTLLTADPIAESDLTLYAVFKDRASHTVRFMDGSTVLGTQTGYDGRSLILDMQDPVSAGKVFVKWMLGDREVERGDTVLMDGDKEIMSVWNKKTLNITFHIDENAVITYDYGTNVTLEFPKVEKEGYTLSGWSTTPNGPVTYSEGGSVVLTSDLHLYPCWTGNGMLVVNLHDYLGRSLQTEVEPGASFMIPNPTVRDGKQFSGWAVKANGEVVYDSGNVLTITDNTDLYEIWSNQTAYVVTMIHYDRTEKATVNSNSDYTLPTVQNRSSHDFLGWSRTENDEPTYRNGETIRITSDITLREIWSEKEKFTVTIHESRDGVKTAYVGETITVTLPAITKSGFTLSGWDEKEDSSSPKYRTGDTLNETHSIDLYPVWKASEKYTIRIHMIDDLKEFEVLDGDSIELPSSLGTIDGRTHTGWGVNEDGSGRFYPPDSKMKPTQSMDLYPYWTDQQMIIITIYDGDTMLDSFKAPKGDAVGLSELDAPSKEGYLLKGWSKTKDSRTVTYGLDSEFKASTNTSLYCVWEKLIVITFIDGDDSNVEYVKKGEQVEMPILEKSGFKFLGWSKEGSEGLIEGLKPTKDTTLISVWEEIKTEKTEDDPKPADDTPMEIPQNTPEPDGDEQSEGSDTSSGTGTVTTTRNIIMGAAVAVVVSILVVFQIRRG